MSDGESDCPTRPLKRPRTSAPITSYSFDRRLRAYKPGRKDALLVKFTKYLDSSGQECVVERVTLPAERLRRETHRNAQNQHHNIDGPSERTWYYDGSRHCVSYHVNGKLHREHGPAEITWYTGSSGPWSASASFCINGRMHNVRGPARILWFMDGSPPAETWWEDHVTWPEGGGPKAKAYQEQRRKRLAAFVFATEYAKPVWPLPIEVTRLIADEID